MSSSTSKSNRRSIGSRRVAAQRAAGTIVEAPEDRQPGREESAVRGAGPPRPIRGSEEVAGDAAPVVGAEGAADHAQDQTGRRAEQVADPPGDAAGQNRAAQDEHSRHRHSLPTEPRWLRYARPL